MENVQEIVNKDDEIAMIQAYRSLDDGLKKAILNMILCIQEEEKKRKTQ